MSYSPARRISFRFGLVGQSDVAFTRLFAESLVSEGGGAERQVTTLAPLHLLVK